MRKNKNTDNSPELMCGRYTITGKRNVIIYLFLLRTARNDLSGRRGAAAGYNLRQQ